MTARFVPRAQGATTSVYGNGSTGVSREPIPFLEPAAMMHVRFGHDGPLSNAQSFDLWLTDPWTGPNGARIVDEDAWVTHPAPRGIWTASQGPPRDAISVSWHDVVFSVTADYLYDPIPHPEGEEDEEAATGAGRTDRDSSSPRWRDRQGTRWMSGTVGRSGTHA